MRVATRVQRRPGHDLLKEIWRDQARAREGGQQTAGPKQLQRQQVNVLIAPRSAFNLAVRFGELGRVEHDEIKLAARIAVAAQYLEHVAFHIFDQAWVQAV